MESLTKKEAIQFRMDSIWRLFEVSFGGSGGGREGDLPFELDEG
jgi:hypothetical protein